MSKVVPFAQPISSDRIAAHTKWKAAWYRTWFASAPKEIDHAYEDRNDPSRSDRADVFFDRTDLEGQYRPDLSAGAGEQRGVDGTGVAELRRRGAIASA